MDYHELKRLGGAWTHDTHTGQWAPDTVKKLNADKRPVNLSLMDLPKVNQPGIDAVWEHDGHYTVTEAKASESIAVAYAFGKYKVKKGWIPDLEGIDPDHALLHYLLSDSSDKRETLTPLMQMSHEWVEERAPREGLPIAASIAITEQRYERRTVLVTVEAAGAVDHGAALADLHVGKNAGELHPHAEHGVTREWNAAAVDAVLAARRKAHARARGVDQKAGPQPPISGDQPKSTKRKKGKR